MSRHIDASTIIFVNDPYDVAESLKSEEHAKRKSNLYIYVSKNVHVRPMDDLQSKTSLTNFFMNKSNEVARLNFDNKLNHFQRKRIFFLYNGNVKTYKQDRKWLI